MRCLCYVALTVALYAGVCGACGRAAPWWGAAGLGLALLFLALLGWGEPTAPLWCLAILAVALWARRRWRAYQDDVARWRGERNQALQGELHALRQRRRDA